MTVGVATALALSLLVLGSCAPAGVGVGEEGQLDAGGGESAVIVARTRAENEALVKAGVANDSYAFAEALLADRAFQVPRGTRVLVIDQGQHVRRIRVLEGSFAAQTGWVPVEFVVKK